MPKANDMIVQVLEEAGIEYVFGIPGGGTGAIYNSLFEKQDKIRVILVRHEQSAAIMADAYGRATGKPAAIMGQGVFMGSNASFGIMEAALSSSPMLVLTDTSDGNMAQKPANQSGLGEYGSIDLPSIFRSMTKYTTLTAHPKEAVLGTQLAIKHAVTGRPGPACVLMRSASITGEVDLERAPFIHPTDGYLRTSTPQPPAQDIERVAEMLAKAKNPVMVAGHGVRISGAEEELVKLAELLGMPVATTYKGKSAIAETHRLALGMLGQYGQSTASSVVGDSDVVLAVGAKLTPQDTIRENPSVLDPLRQKIVQVDIEARNTGWSMPVDEGLVGDARVILRQIIEAVQPLVSGTSAEKRSTALQRRKDELGFFSGDPLLTTDSSPASPQRVVRLLQENLDPASLITLDAGNNRVWMAHLYKSQQPDTIFAPGGMAGMGWATPAACALQLINPGKPIVAVTGDGGFMMTNNALSTAVQYDLPIVVVVFNDSALGMVRHHQAPGQRIASEFVEADHGQIARGFGADGVQVTDSKDLPKVVREAQASGKPTVIDVVIDRGPNPDDLRATARTITET